MKDFITKEEFDIIEDLVKKATCAYTKADATYYIKALELKKTNFDGYTCIVFSNLVSSVNRASGQVEEKERFLYYVDQDLGKLKRLIKK